ncbi:MAG: RuBisCO large subunit C-terminal-like domain-containing protein [Casimicrobiaceae bacterium]
MSWIDVTYRVRGAADEIGAIANALALEQSVEVPAGVIRDAFVAEHIVGRVDTIRDAGDGTHLVAIRLATVTTGGDVAQTINMLFGNSSLHDHVELADADFPPDFLARFPGPRFGIEGLRALLDAPRRPLTCAALKPQGLSPERLAALCYTLALAGIDVIKDDHGLADQEYAPFAARVAECQRAIERAQRETGRRALYAPSLVGGPTALAVQARVARAEGAGMVLVAPALVGMPAFAELVAGGLGVPVLAHPAYAGAARVAPSFLLGKWFRLLGADAIIFPNFGGRFAWSERACVAIANNARKPWAHLPASLPVPGGGMSVARSCEIVRCYGADVMLLIGGSLLAAGDQLLERTRAFVAAVHDSAAVQN